MKVRKTLVALVGMLQSIVAVLTVIFALGLHFNFFSVQAWLNGEIEFSYVHFTALLVFGFFSIISGSLLVQEWLESR